MYENITIKHFPIKYIFSFLDDRRFAIPKLQRDFVWDIKKASNLLDSINKSLPIGTILIWETDRQNSNLLQRSLTALPIFDDNNKHVWFILDGQQRLSVLHKLREGKEIKNSKNKIVPFDKIYLTIDSENRGRFSYLKRHDTEKQISICDILSNTWKKRLKRFKSSKRKYNYIFKCREQLLNYPIPFIFFHSKDIFEAREAFIRINALGTPLTTADKVFSRASAIDLRHLAKEMSLEWSDGFQNIPQIIILQVLAFCWGKIEVGEKALDNVIDRITNQLNSEELSKDEFNKKWKDIKDAVNLSLDYLRTNFFVKDFELLPSTNMIATLAMFFIYNKKRQPNNVAQKQLIKWFWATAVAQRYSGKGYRDNIIEDVRFFQRLAGNGTGRFVFNEKIPKAKILYADYSKGAALTRAFFCLLISKGPRYLENNTEIPIATVCASYNKKQKHHIFPKQLLRNHGFGAKEYNRICNICFIVAPENQSIGANKPRNYLPEYLDNRSLPSFLRSHLIPCEKNSYIWCKNIKKDYKKFLRERMNLLCEEFERVASMKLFAEE